MPVVSRSQLPGGRVRTSFAPSPRMSTYVFGFAVGPFCSVEKALTNRLKVRVLCIVLRRYASGMPEDGLFALDFASKALEFYQDYFAVAFPLPKLDLVALPELSPDGMENWGFITFRDTALLLDPTKASPQAQKAVVLTVCHEVAHQWFGNLVTLGSWSDLWLNEGFASFLMYKCAMVCAPNLIDSTEFVVRELSSALEADSLQSTHPLMVPECQNVDVLDIFDAVSYSKGAALVMMLHEYLGPDVFRGCIQDYLELYRFDCTSSSDLLTSFSRSSGQPLEELFRSWIHNAGYPVISVLVKDNELTLKQQQFFADGTPGPPDKVWCVPITIATTQQPKLIAKRFLLKTKEIKMNLRDICHDAKYFKINVRTTGFYRVLYEETLLKGVVECADGFTVNDRIGLMDDLFALARAGYLSTRLALEHCFAFLNETNANVWRCFDACVWSLEDLLSTYGEAGSDAFRAFLRHTLGPQYSRVNWASRAPADQLLQRLLLLRLGTAGHPNALRSARRWFWRDVRGGTPVPGYLLASVLSAVLNQGGARELDAVMKLFRKANCQESEQILAALGFTQTSLLDRVFNFALTGDLRSKQRLDLLQSCATATPESRRLTWRFARSRWENVAALSDGLFGPGELVTALCYGLVGVEALREMEEFFAQHDVGSPGAVRECIANVKITTAQLERDGADLLAFFQRFLPRAPRTKRKWKDD